mgnify:CR=1 FL=1
MKIKNLIVATPLPFILIACDDGWTEAQEKEYKQDCILLSSTTKEQCDCAFDKFSAEYSYHQYSSTGEKSLSDNEISNAIIIDKEIRKCFD